MLFKRELKQTQKFAIILKSFSLKQVTKKIGTVDEKVCRFIEKFTCT